MKFFPSLFITLALIFLLDRSWPVGSIRIPPPGKFLDPFHGFWQNAEPKGFVGPDELNINGLKDKVVVSYDSLLIPHIFASNEEDLYLAQGYITAVHRLWQMEFQTHAAAGRIASILGAGRDSIFLKYDRNQRRLGLTYAAQKAVDTMMQNPTSQKMVEKYTEGVNQYIRSLTYRNLPLEYKLMDYLPEDWTPLKCGLLLKSMSQTLNMGDKDIEMTNALKLYGKEMVGILYPDRELQVDPIVNNPNGWNFAEVTLDSVPHALPEQLISTTTRREEADPTVGSNNWAVSGGKTATGSPILCNDPHLNTTLPSTWYAVQLNAPGVNVMGVSLPGTPCVIIGFTDSIAWGLTNAQRDLVDWYKITYKDDQRNYYLLDSEWIETEKVIEQINIRGEGTYYDTVVYTNWGPIPYDKNFRPDDGLRDYAFRWISHDPSLEIMTFYELNRAQNYDDYMKALDFFSSPAQNFAFASVSGDIAIRVQGKFPVRRKDEGKFLLDGSKSSNGWQAFIPFDQNVMVKNPERGFVSSANQYPVDETYPYYITATSYEAYRNRRINDLLRKFKNITVKDMMLMQNDNYNLKASECLPIFLQVLRESFPIEINPSDTFRLIDQVNDVYKVLASWDYVNNRDAEGASYFESWWDHFVPMLWDEMSDARHALSKPTSYNTIQLIREDSIPEGFVDLKSTPAKETLNDIILQSFMESVAAVDRWKEVHGKENVRWADYKDTYIQHIARLAPLSERVQHGGNRGIVNASDRTHGPSWRMVVSLEKSGLKAYGVYPGGQSGNPGSKHYIDMLNHWANGMYFSLAFPRRKEEMKGRLFFTTQLNPKNK